MTRLRVINLHTNENICEVPASAFDLAVGVAERMHRETRQPHAVIAVATMHRTDNGGLVERQEPAEDEGAGG